MPKYRVTRHTFEANTTAPFTMEKVVSADTKEGVGAIPTDTVDEVEDAVPECDWRVIEAPKS